MKMNCFKIFFIALSVLLIASSASAVDPPKIVTEAFDAYKNEGFNKAFDIWMKGSPLENDKTSLMNVRGGMTQIETMYGEMIGYEIIKTYPFTKYTIRTYALVLYEKGPLYMYIDCYKSNKGWIIPELLFHTKAQMILPSDLIHEK